MLSAIVDTSPKSNCPFPVVSMAAKLTSDNSLSVSHAMTVEGRREEEVKKVQKYKARFDEQVKFVSTSNSLVSRNLHAVSGAKSVSFSLRHLPLP